MAQGPKRARDRSTRPKGQDEQKQAERVSEWSLGTILQNRLKSGLESGPYTLTGPWRSPGASLDLARPCRWGDDPLHMASLSEYDAVSVTRGGTFKEAGS